MLTNIIEILILSLIQGVSEFLPISSSAHLVVISTLYEFHSYSLLIDVSLHLGSLLAIIFFSMFVFYTKICKSVIILVFQLFSSKSKQVVRLSMLFNEVQYSYNFICYFFRMTLFSEALPFLMITTHMAGTYHELYEEKTDDILFRCCRIF